MQNNRTPDRPAVRLDGDSHRLHYTEHDFAKIGALMIDTPTGRWRAGGSMSAAGRLQDAALLAFSEAGNAIIKVKADTDLTPEAKSRRVIAAADAYVNQVGPIVKELNAGMASLAETAPRMLSAVQPLKEGDMVGELRDQELRAFMRSASQSERQKIVMAMNRGEHEELTAAVMRGPAIVSGLNSETVDSLNRAGIATSYRASINELHNLLMVRDDVIRTALSGIQSLGHIDANAQAAGIRANAWRSDDGADALRSWLADFRFKQAA